MKSSGGYIWACKNYDGDVQSDSVAQGEYLSLFSFIFAKENMSTEFMKLYMTTHNK